MLSYDPQTYNHVVRDDAGREWTIKARQNLEAGWAKTIQKSWRDWRARRRTSAERLGRGVTRTVRHLSDLQHVSHRLRNVLHESQHVLHDP